MLLQDRSVIMTRGLKPRTFESGDWVWRWYPPKANTGTKLGLGWTGPYLVVRKITAVTYAIQRDENGHIITVHVDNLKPYEGTSQIENWLNHANDISVNGVPSSPSIEDGTNIDLEVDTSDNTGNDVYIVGLGGGVTLTRRGRAVNLPSRFR